ncbi:TIGR03089 family protein [Nocardioides sp. cx-173]|uniref:TIGR03089 family protein n=1 Tax=Nocardioides sp. cx-173 TaxID=2898796 RepID=UPI001E59F724|nr:TIGR03089 family protein [Nocardioides sp. cx-173]MCD4525335.1 TIGR03089 family protein [Nocardioides sp. cx-173]UGB40868.1 TIGR03089 family protein [Nocardioides sp. cx-173]
MTTFPAVLARRLRADGGRPLVTFYDDASGERVELSVTTYANWVAKAASLLVEELELERGDRLRVDLPAHWLGPVFLGAAWTAGLVVTDADTPDAVVCGPDTLDAWAPRAEELPVLACSLLPLGVRFAEPVPTHVHDVGAEIWSQPDSFVPWDPPQADDPATCFGGVDVTQEELWRTAATGTLVTDGGRLLSVANPASPPGVATFSEPLAKGGSLVLVAHAERERLEATYAAEHATARFPA